ncbi:MAG: iron chaperone [Chitinophagaceae bacterium]
MKTIAYENVDIYIASFPKEVAIMLEQLRTIIKDIAPNAKEIISYNMPAYKLNKVLVYFAGYKHHIGFYPSSSGVANFEKELIAYKTSKGAIQFPLDKALPLELITKIVLFRLKEDAMKIKK